MDMTQGCFPADFVWNHSGVGIMTRSVLLTCSDFANSPVDPNNFACNCKVINQTGKLVVSSQVSTAGCFKLLSDLKLLGSHLCLMIMLLRSSDALQFRLLNHHACQICISTSGVMMSMPGVRPQLPQAATS